MQKPIATSPTGLTVWSIPNSELEIMWPGRGSGLFIGKPRIPPTEGGFVTRITHPVAADIFDTRSEAQAAVDRFIAA